MVDQSPEHALSPLEQIRRTEAEVTRKIAAARENAEQILTDARRQAATLQQAATETGAREGQARYKADILSAEEEALAIVAEAKTKAKKLSRRGQKRMHAGVSLALNLVIGRSEDKQAI